MGQRSKSSTFFRFVPVSYLVREHLAPFDLGKVPGETHQETGKDFVGALNLGLVEGTGGGKQGAVSGTVFSIKSRNPPKKTTGEKYSYLINPATRGVARCQPHRAFRPHN